jgi:hypothetical protein
MVIRRIFGSKRDEVRGESRTLHNMELYTLPNTLSVVKRRDEMGRKSYKKEDMHTNFGWKSSKEKTLTQMGNKY